MKKNYKTLLCLLFLLVLACPSKEQTSESVPDGATEEAVEESVDEGTTDMNFEVEDSYKCPMDCEEGKEYDEEGNCPVCGMQLKHVDDEAHYDSNGHHHDEDNDHEHHEQEGKTDNKLKDE